MGAERAVIWRHGQTAYNKARRIQGQSDIPLDETGLAQAATAAEQLVELEPGAIVSSDLVRAAATAGALAALTGLEVSLDTRLRERNFGDWEGESAANLHERWPAEFALWRQGHDIESIGMERRSKAAARVAAAVEAAADAAADGSTLVVATHGGASVCGITALLGLDPETWFGLRVMRNAHWAVLERGRVLGPPWRLVGYDLGELEGAPGMNPWT